MEIYIINEPIYLSIFNLINVIASGFWCFIERRERLSEHVTAEFAQRRLDKVPALTPLEKKFGLSNFESILHCSTYDFSRARDNRHHEYYSRRNKGADTPQHQGP